MVQAREKQPKIVTEDLQPKDTIAGYKFTWEERGLRAWADLLPVEDQPARGFILECSYDTVSGRDPSNRQIDLGTTLTSNVRELMLGQMARAGWREIGRNDQRRTIWQHSSRITASSASEQDQPAPVPVKKASVKRKGNQAAPFAPVGQASRTLLVPAREKVSGYKRTITASDVTYTCVKCGDQVTKALFPGATPQYCDNCALEVKREKTRARVQRLRAGKKQAS